MGGGLRYGFKAEAERLALELRGEIDLGAHGRLDPHDLADEYAIPVVGLSDLDVDPEHAQYFTATNPGEWSALTVFDGTRRMIVLNDSHADTRLANSLAHELSHLFLEHEPKAVRADDGTFSWQKRLEREADYLGGALLIPKKAAKRCAINGWAREAVADKYQVSEALARWRLNITGAKKIAGHLG